MAIDREKLARGAERTRQAREKARKGRAEGRGYGGYGSTRDPGGRDYGRDRDYVTTGAKANRARAAADAKAKKDAASKALAEKVALAPDVTPATGPMIEEGDSRSLIKEYFTPLDRTTVTGGVGPGGVMTTTTRSQSLAQRLGSKLLSAFPGLSVDIYSQDEKPVTDASFSPAGFVGGTLGMLSPIPGGATVGGLVGEKVGEATGTNIDVDRSYETASLVTEPAISPEAPSGGSRVATRRRGREGGMLTQAAAATPRSVAPIQAAVPKGGYGGSQGLLSQVAATPSPYGDPTQRFGRSQAADQYVYDETLGRVVLV